MKVLIVNDDGYKAKGIHALASKLSAEHEVIVIAPLEECSGISHAITFFKPLNYTEIDGYPYKCYAVNGTPSDCVKFGISIICDATPDIVVSGINNTTNLGTEIVYSGTVNAALEAEILGYKSIAVSADCEDEYEFAAEYISKRLCDYYELLTEFKCVLNVNIPSRNKFKGEKLAKIGTRLYNDAYHEVKDKGYFITGHPLKVSQFHSDNDIDLFEEGFVTVTPLTLQFTDNDLYGEISENFQ